MIQFTKSQNGNAVGAQESRRKRFNYRKLLPYLLVAPAMVFLCTFVVYPIINLIYLSFTDWNMISPVKRYVGIRNYKILFLSLISFRPWETQWSIQ